jgi:hypothetical protein
MMMQNSGQGGCQCGKVRYTLKAKELPRTYCCHCLDCQTGTGTAFSQTPRVAETEIELLGATEIFEVTSSTGSTGQISRRYSCRSCFTRLYNSNSTRPGIIALRAGTLDESHTLKVVAHIWTKRKQSWIVLPEDVKCWPESAPIDEFATVVGM